MRPLHAGLATVTSCLAFAIVTGCTGGGTKDVSATRIDVVFRTPINETGAAAFCQGAQSLVLALDSAGGQSGSWDRVFVLGVADQSLYGCGRDQDGRLVRCKTPEIQTKLNSPERVLAEWLDVPAATYAAERGNVVCRGMYDDELGMGERNTSDKDGVRTLTLTLLLLRVGDTNYLHDLGGATSPRGQWMAASPLVHPTDLLAVFGQRRDSEGGHVVVAGGQLGPGVVTGEIHVFEPDDIKFQLEGTLPFAAAGLTATPIASSATSSYVLFAGGWGVDGLAKDAAATFDYLEDASVVSTSLRLEFPRAHHAAFRLDRIGPAAAPRNAIGLFGGCDANLTSPAPRGAEVFYLGEPLPVNGCRRAGPGYLCDAGGVATDGIPRCHMAAGPLRSSIDSTSTLRGWMAGGFLNGAVASDASRYEAQSDGFFVQQVGSATPYLDRAGAATVPFRADLLSVIGGVTGSGIVSTSLVFVSGNNPSVVIEVPGGGLQKGRSFHTATRLADRSILVTGGLPGDGDSALVVEIGRTTAFSPAAVIEFSYPVKVGGNTCATGAEAGCVVLKEARFGHTATRIEGTKTWLNGSVVIAGGSETADPEIYVPAYACDEVTGLVPVAIVAGSEEALEIEVDFCDRGRAAIGPVTNPDAP